MKLNKQKGFTLIELLFVIVVMSIVIAIAGSFSSSFSSRRKVDSVTNSISSNIQISKLQAARDGVEHRVSITMPDSETLQIVRERGDSNTVSSTWTELSSYQVRLENNLLIDLPSQPVIFKPTGASVNPGTCIIKPTTSANYKRCGQVTVSNFGIIEIVKGNWDGSDCNQYGDG